jgi:hypothetical protein
MGMIGGPPQAAVVAGERYFENPAKEDGSLLKSCAGCR